MYVPDGVDKTKYRRFLDNAYKKYYLRPRYIWSQLKNIKSLEDLKRMYKGFFAIFNL